MNTKTQLVASEQSSGERVAELEREKETVLQDRVALAMRVEELERVLGVARDAMESAIQTAKFEKHPYRPWHAECASAIATIDAARSKEGADMSDRDPIWDALKEHSAAKFNEDRSKFLNQAVADDDGKWTKHTAFHWSRQVNGERLDYWPSRKKFQYRGRVMRGLKAMYAILKDQHHD